ncbi:MAG: FAD-dependent oxidoreductase [Solirubrobacterales bacterium]|nr:FAD-dependent oxidoreductase [Solirubrobacterales bacterium]MCB8916225.1 FAD-dependent oxidoreductase [Thermoleophilales bacterium]
MIHKAFGYWIEEAGPQPEFPVLEGEQELDVIVVGGGFTGLWTAFHLKSGDPGLEVGLIESHRIGHGPSGRNGGFVDAMWVSFASLVKRYGSEAALRLARMAEASVREVGEFCEAHEVDAWYRHSGYLNVSTAPAQDGSWEGNLKAMREAGIIDGPRELTPTEVQEICASPAFRAGVHYGAAATVQPARLAFGIREACRGLGVRLFEGSPVTKVEDRPGSVTVTTPYGRARAAKAVLSNGPTLASQGSPLSGAITLASSHMVITEPVPEVIEELGWTGGEAISDCRALLTYFRTTPDGRIAFGWGGGRIAAGARRFGRAELDADVINGVITGLRRYFPMLEKRELDYAWGGPIDASPTHLPHVVALPSGRAFAAFGYTGNGVGPSQMVGRTLASLVLELDDEYRSLPFIESAEALTRVPPEPFRWVGGAMIREAIGRKEEAELTGRSVDPVSAAVARIPQLIGFHIGR